MKKLYCNGKKDYCPHFDGIDLTNCKIHNCKFFDGSGSKYIDVPKEASDAAGSDEKEKGR